MGGTEITQWTHHLSIARMIAERINEITATLPETVALIAVSKTKPVSDLKEAYDAGQRAFGENKVQELVDLLEIGMVNQLKMIIATKEHS